MFWPFVSGAVPRLRRQRSSIGRFAAALCGAALTTLAARASAATFDCVMHPSVILKLGSPISSVLSDVLVDRGDIVKKGQIIARIESAVERGTVAIEEARASSDAEIEAKKALLEQKKGVFSRKRELQARSAASTQDVDNARAEYDVAKQELALARLNKKIAGLELEHSKALLAQRTIRSPIDGIVVERDLGPGEYVRPDAHIVTIASIHPLNVETYLPVRDYGLIKVGEPAVVHPDQPVGGHYTAEISVVDQVFDAASGTFGVRLRLPNPRNLLPGGLRCHVTFDFPERPEMPFDPAAKVSNNPR